MAEWCVVVEREDSERMDGRRDAFDWWGAVGGEGRVRWIWRRVAVVLARAMARCWLAVSQAASAVARSRRLASWARRASVWEGSSSVSESALDIGDVCAGVNARKRFCVAWRQK